eukprot:7632339-Pyramimonas_sp.AAC.1
MGMVSRRWPSVPLSVPPWTSRTQMRPSGLAGMGLSSLPGAGGAAAGGGAGAAPLTFFSQWAGASLAMETAASATLL